MTFDFIKSKTFRAYININSYIYKYKYINIYLYIKVISWAILRKIFRTEISNIVNAFYITACDESIFVEALN